MAASINNLVKKLFSMFGFRLSRYKPDDWQSHLYPESSRPNKPTYVNIGAGDFYHPMWTNVDMPNQFYKKLQDKNTYIVHDLCSSAPLPFESNSVAIFYTSHVIEHLPQEAVKNLFSQINRCLMPGGVFRITCPDMEIQYRAYQARDKYFWPQPSPWLTSLPTLEERFLEHFATALVSFHVTSLPREAPRLCRGMVTGESLSFNALLPIEFESIFYSNSMSDFFDKIINRLPPNINGWLPEGHCNWFTEDKVIGLLHNSGFRTIYSSGYGKSNDARLRNVDLFDSTSPSLSLYVESYK